MIRRGQRPWRPAAPRPRNSPSRVLVTLASASAATALLIAIALLNPPTRDQIMNALQPSRSTMEASSSPSSLEPLGEFVTHRQPPRPDWLPEETIEELPHTTSFPEELTHHPLFQAEYPVADCPDIQPFETHEEFRRHTQELAECMIEAWRPHFATLGLDLEPVQVIAHTGQISTPCRQLSDWYQVIYCPENRTIYLSSRSFKYVSEHPTEGTMAAIHETFHHIQYQSGMAQAGHALREVEPRERTRRLELQTICSESRQALTLGIGFTEEDYQQVMHPRGRTDSETHGSNESYTYWAGRGFHVTTLQGCNTWIVPADMVD